jgi:hypothetical protein
LLNYLPKNFIVAIDEPEQCQSYGDRWYEAAEELISSGGDTQVISEQYLLVV